MAKRKTKSDEAAPKPAAAPAAAPIEEGLRIVSLEVENVKRVKLARIRPHGNMVVVSGKNGAGKSSLLDAIAWALTGTTGLATKPIRAGQRSAKIRVNLGEFVVTRLFNKVEHSAKGLDHLTKLFIEGKNREQYPTPQRLLDGFLGAFTFDPLAFVRLDADAQVQALRKVAKFSEDIDALEAQKKQVYDERRIRTRELEAAKARLKAMPTPPPDLPAEPVDIAALTRRLQEAATHNEQAGAAERKKQQMVERAEYAEKEAHGYRDEARKLLAKAAQIDGLHVTLPREGQQKDNGAAQQLRREAEAVSVPERINTAEIAAELESAQFVNRAIERRAAREAVEREVGELQANFETLDRQHRELDERRTRAIETATMPIEGLGVGEDEVLWQGLPFGQASMAEQIRVSAAIAMATSPKLRVMRIVDGSLLDDDSMDALRTMAEQHNYQIWVERVGGDGTVGVVMEDGEAHGAETVA